VALDRLISRDGHRVEEAVAILKGRPACTESAPLRQMASRLPRRVRNQAVTPETFEGLAPVGFHDPIESQERSVEQRRALARLQHALRQLSPDDRRLVELRYRRGMTIRDIAAGLGQPDKPLYRRMERIVAALRGAMAEDVPSPEPR
jgi:RNA polymerase sigma factor (sigma-70 family)